MGVVVTYVTTYVAYVGSLKLISLYFIYALFILYLYLTNLIKNVFGFYRNCCYSKRLCYGR